VVHAWCASDPKLLVKCKWHSAEVAPASTEAMRTSAFTHERTSLGLSVMLALVNALAGAVFDA
jgi:hypothetical protein